MTHPLLKKFFRPGRPVTVYCRNGQELHGTLIRLANDTLTVTEKNGRETSVAIDDTYSVRYNNLSTPYSGHSR